jgi:hypothetical protein
MLIAFELSMPNVGSWNGRWTGEKDLYVRVKKLPKQQAESILQKPTYSYNFGDGWRASIKATQVDSKEATGLRKKSRGFCGYDWMIDSIIKKGFVEWE